ncbi:MAG TPA: hypothetical protein DHW63_07925 [Hyphomonadaceae bacterium]|nr:hypothetical protein [Hyphomonadaceae bacterium]
MAYAGYALWALAAGALIPVMAILNAGLARATGSPAIAASVLFLVGFLFNATIALASGGRGAGALATAPPHLFLGGLIVGFYVLSITMLAPRFGVGNAILFVMVAQIFTSAAVDHFALFGAVQRLLTAQRSIGLVIMVVGLAVAQLSQGAR